MSPFRANARTKSQTVWRSAQPAATILTSLNSLPELGSFSRCMGQLSPSLRTTSTQPRKTLTPTTVPLHDEVIAVTVTAKMMGIDGDDVDRDATTADKWRRQ